MEYLYLQRFVIIYFKVLFIFILLLFFQIPCRCILKIYREWIYIHKTNVPFKDNKNLNKRWDTRNHPFYQKVLNGNFFTSMEHII